MQPSINRFTQDAVVSSTGEWVVDIIRQEGNDLENGEKSIGLFQGYKFKAAFNWRDADEVAEALKRVTGVARNG